MAAGSRAMTRAPSPRAHRPRASSLPSRGGAIYSVRPRTVLGQLSRRCCVRKQSCPRPRGRTIRSYEFDQLGAVKATHERVRGPHLSPDARRWMARPCSRPRVERQGGWFEPTAGAPSRFRRALPWPPYRCCPCRTSDNTRSGRTARQRAPETRTRSASSVRRGPKRWRRGPAE